MKLIDKSALVAEIDKRLHQLTDAAFDSMIGRNLIAIKDFLDAIEMKEVEEPNASDRGTAEEIIINLKRVEQDYRIDLTKEIEWVRNQAKKGK